MSILLGDQWQAGICVCVNNLAKRGTAGIEPANFQSQVQRPSHFIHHPATALLKSNSIQCEQTGANISLCPYLKQRKRPRRFAPCRLADDILGRSSWGNAIRNTTDVVCPDGRRHTYSVSVICVELLGNPPSTNDRPTCNTPQQHNCGDRQHTNWQFGTNVNPDPNPINHTR